MPLVSPAEETAGKKMGSISEVKYSFLLPIAKLVYCLLEINGKAPVHFKGCHLTLTAKAISMPLDLTLFPQASKSGFL